MPLKKNMKFPKEKFFRKKGNIFGIGITGTPRSKLLMGIKLHLTKMRRSEAKIPLFITTPNPEHALFAKKDTRFKEILQKSDIAICDGVGLLASYEYLYRRNRDGGASNNQFVKFRRFLTALLYILEKRKTSDGIR